MELEALDFVWIMPMIIATLSLFPLQLFNKYINFLALAVKQYHMAYLYNIESRKSQVKYYILLN